MSTVIEKSIGFQSLDGVAAEQRKRLDVLGWSRKGGLRCSSCAKPKASKP